MAIKCVFFNLSRIYVYQNGYLNLWNEHDGLTHRFHFDNGIGIPWKPEVKYYIYIIDYYGIYKYYLC